MSETLDPGQFHFGPLIFFSILVITNNDVSFQSDSCLIIVPFREANRKQALSFSLFSLPVINLIHKYIKERKPGVTLFFAIIYLFIY